MIDVLCPIKPHDLDKPMRRGMERIAEKVAGAAVIHNLGRDLLLLVYMAGFWHAFEAMKRTRDSGSRAERQDAEERLGPKGGRAADAVGIAQKAGQP